MKKIIFLIIAIAIFVGALTSCGGDETVYYGAVMKYDQSGSLAVNIPTLGLCEIPSAEKITSDFNGKKNKSYTLEEGDLVRITFKDADELVLMETYPARFSMEASEIVAYAKNVSLEYEIYPGRNPICRLTCPVEDMPAGANSSDLIAFCYGGNNDVTAAYCYGTVYMVHAGKITVELELVNGIEDFLSKYPDSFTMKLVQ